MSESFANTSRFEATRIFFRKFADQAYKFRVDNISGLSLFGRQFGTIRELSPIIADFKDGFNDLATSGSNTRRFGWPGETGLHSSFVWLAMLFGQGLAGTAVLVEILDNAPHGSGLRSESQERIGSTSACLSTRCSRFTTRCSRWLLFQSRNLTSIDFRQGRYAKER
jgi:hypothetical protein